MPEPTLPKTLEEAHEIILSQAKIIEHFQYLLGKVEELEARIEELTSGQKSSSRNSSNPPSSDSPEQRNKRRKKPRSSRNKGAQPGHKKHERALLPEQEVDEKYAYYPNPTCSCGGGVSFDQEPRLRHQVFDLPEIKCHVVEHQVYNGCCSQCGKTHHGSLPDSVPSGQMGAGLIAWIVLMTGQFHLSMRKTQRLLKEQWQLSFSTGAISEAQGKAVDWLGVIHHQIGEAVRQEPVANADETRHFRGAEQRWFWALVTPMLSFFMVHNSRGKTAANILLQRFKGFLVTDHYSGYNDHPKSHRQLCWAHLIRHFIQISERNGEARLVGQRLCLIAYSLFRVKKRYEEKRLDLWHYKRRMRRLRKSFQITLKRGSILSTSCRTANQCTHLLKDEEMCWTFLNDDRIPLTNNQAERDIRPYVIWRKLSFASQSFQGDRFRPMVLSIVGTSQKMGLSTYAVMRQICHEGLINKHISMRLPLGRMLP